MMRFTSLVGFSAAFILCLHGCAEKITLCHAQSINSAITPCVNFGLGISLKYHGTLGR